MGPIILAQRLHTDFLVKCSALHILFLPLFCCCDQKFKIYIQRIETKYAEQKYFAFPTDNTAVSRGLMVRHLSGWHPMWMLLYTSPIVYPLHPLWMLLFSCTAQYFTNNQPLATPVNAALPIVYPCTAPIVYQWSTPASPCLDITLYFRTLLLLHQVQSSSTTIFNAVYTVVTGYTKPQCNRI